MIFDLALNDHIKRLKVYLQIREGAKN
jgi:hypothetical protein